MMKLNFGDAEGLAPGLNVIDACATCGKREGLKQCNACHLVKYCSIACQKAHWPRHKTDCKRKAMELFNEKLFAPPPKPDEFPECPICLLPLPILPRDSRYKFCCGKIVCFGCCDEHDKHDPTSCCPFCRAKRAMSDEEQLERLQKRMDKDDPIAFHTLGSKYMEGGFGLMPDMRKSIQLWRKASELGSSEVDFILGCSYMEGEGVKKDEKKAIGYFQRAAIAGNLMARHRLGHMAESAHNIDLAVKHWMISASGGYDDSLSAIRRVFTIQSRMPVLPGAIPMVSRENFAKVLRAYQEAVEARKSPQRERASRVRKM